VLDEIGKEAEPLDLSVTTALNDAPTPTARARHVVLMGPPGAGKGTQAGTVARLAGLVHVASGDLFRDAVRSGSDIGMIAQSFMDRGELVPDDVTVRIVMTRLDSPDCETGFILDGFPRSVGQAEALDDVLRRQGRALDMVINLVVPDEELISRLSGRWLCSRCHSSYHERFNPPRVAGICDKDGERLYQRIDDRVDTARNRLHVYESETVPVLRYYSRGGRLIEVDGNQPMEEVTEALRSLLMQ
jgi:adenylate kinase